MNFIEIKKKHVKTLRNNLKKCNKHLKFIKKINKLQSGGKVDASLVEIKNQLNFNRNPPNAINPD